MKEKIKVAKLSTAIDEKLVARIQALTKKNKWKIKDILEEALNKQLPEMEKEKTK